MLYFVYVLLPGTVTFYTRFSSRVTLHPVQLRYVHNKTTENIPTLKSLFAEMYRLSELGCQLQVLDVLHTMERLNYPIYSNIFICRLLIMSVKFNNKDVFTKVLDLIDNHIPYDRQVYASVINGLLAFSGYEDAMKVYSEMISKGIIPHNHLVRNMFSNSVKQGDIENTIVLLNQLFARCILPSSTSMEEFLTICLNNRLHDQVIKLLKFYSTYNIPIEDTLANQLMVYFDNYRDR